jgi:hypothetical protein
VIEEVLSYTVDDQMEEVMLLVEEQGDGEVTDLLFRVLRCRDQIDSFEVSKIDVIALNVYVEQFANIFLLLVSIELLTFELLPYVGQLLVNALLLELSSSSIPQVRNELDEPSHGAHFVEAGSESTQQR